MKRRTVALIALLTTVISVRVYAQDVEHARVSFDAGGTLVKGVSDGDWSHATLNTMILDGDQLWAQQGGTSELEFSGGSFVRMADGSSLTVQRVLPQATIIADLGSFYVQRVRRSIGDMRIQTPACVVDIERDTNVRIDLLETGSTTVSVRWGRVTVGVDGGSGTVVTARQQVFIDPGLLPSQPVSFALSAVDDFDAWNSDRAELLAGVESTSIPIAASDRTLGVVDLNPYGNWIDVEGANYWRPRVDYIPYRYGHWSFVPRVGHVWVDNYPFGYVTSHYGRWRHLPQYGWCWRYDPVWSPAWVATVRYGNNFLWTPVDFHHRPVYVGGQTFSVGGVQFSLLASTYVPHNRLYYGSHYVSPVRPLIIQNVTNINIWNINIDSRRHHVQVPYREGRLREFDFRPTKIVRGPERYRGEGPRAREIAMNLERVKERQVVERRQRAPRIEGDDRRTAVTEAERTARFRSTDIAPEQRVIQRGRGVASDRERLEEQRRTTRLPRDEVDLEREAARDQQRDRTPEPRVTQPRGQERSRDAADESPRGRTQRGTPDPRAIERQAPERTPSAEPRRRVEQETQERARGQQRQRVAPAEPQERRSPDRGTPEGQAIERRAPERTPSAAPRTRVEQETQGRARGQERQRVTPAEPQQRRAPESAQPQRQVERQQAERTVEPSEVQRRQVQQRQVEPRQTQPRQLEPRKAQPRIQPQHARPQTQPRQAQPRQVQPRQVQPKQAQPKRVESRQLEPRDQAPRQVERSTPSVQPSDASQRGPAAQDAEERTRGRGTQRQAD